MLIMLVFNPNSVRYVVSLVEFVKRHSKTKIVQLEVQNSL